MKIELQQSDPKLILPPADLLDVVRRAEDYGLDGIGLPDLIRYGLDVYSFFGTALAATSTITLFPAVGNPLTRHPWVLANIASTLGRTAPGRFRLVLGAGTRLNLGRPPARVAEMRDAVTTICTLLSGKDLTLLANEVGGVRYEHAPTAADNQYDQIHTSGLIAARREDAPPVCMAVGGPRMMELAGEVADEALILTGHDKAAIATARAQIGKGAARAGKPLDTYKVSHWAGVYIDDNEDAAYDWLWRNLFVGCPFGTHLNQLSLDAFGMDWPLDRLDDVPESERRRLIDATAFAGPAEKVAERMQDVARAGELDRLVCGVYGEDNEVALNQFARIVLPRVK